MKRKYLFVIAPVFPLLIVVVLAVFGITFDTAVYAVLGVVCPIVAGFVWWIYKDMETKVTAAGKKEAPNDESG